MRLFMGFVRVVRAVRVLISIRFLLFIRLWSLDHACRNAGISIGVYSLPILFFWYSFRSSIASFRLERLPTLTFPVS